MSHQPELSVVEDRHSLNSARVNAPRAVVRTGFDPAATRSALLLFLVSWLLVASAYSGAVSPASGITGLDFRLFYQAAGRLNAGQPLYQLPDPGLHAGLYVYSPLLALLRPLAHLPFIVAMKAWFFINAVSLILAVLLYGAAARLTWRTAPLLAILLLVSFRFWDTTMNFGLGQSNCILLALIGVMFWADSRGRWRLMGALIVLAALVKVWLIGLLLYLLLRRQWKAALFSMIGFAASMAALFCVVGWREWPTFLGSLRLAKTIMENGTVIHSVIGFANLHLRANSLVSPLTDSPAVYTAFIALCAVALLWGITALWRVLREPSPLEARLSFGLVLASVLLPSYENGYFVYCLPLLWTLLVSPDADAAPSSRVMLAGGIAVYLIFSRAWPMYAPFPPAYRHGLLALVISMSFYGTAALWAIGFYCLHKLRPLGRPDASEQPERVPEMLW